MAHAVQRAGAHVSPLWPEHTRAALTLPWADVCPPHRGRCYATALTAFLQLPLHLAPDEVAGARGIRRCWALAQGHRLVCPTLVPAPVAHALHPSLSPPTRIVRRRLPCAHQRPPRAT